MSPDLPILAFDGSLIGFPEARRFALVRIDPDTETLFRLRCLDGDGPDTDGLEFVVAAPYPFFPGYEPEIDESTAQRLGLVTASDAMVLVVLTVGPTLAATTANLFAPIVVNVKTQRASQVMLSDSGYSLREPLAGLASRGTPAAQRIA
jgi:flagellar assembly factor FliW